MQAQKELIGGTPGEIDARARDVAAKLTGGNPAVAPTSGGASHANIDVQRSLANARAAITAGTDRNTVIKRLRDHGIDPAGL